MNQREFRERINKLLADERSEPMRWWYLSYASDEGFRGGVYIEAHGPVEAAYLARHRNLSPGGQVQMILVPPEHVPEDRYRNRLLTREEIETMP